MEIIVTQSSNGYHWARYVGREDTLIDPNGYGHTEEQAKDRLAIDEAHIAKHGTIPQQFPDLFES